MAISVVHSSSAIQGVSATSATSSATFTSTSGNLLVAVGACSGVAGGEGATPWSDGGTNTFTANQSTVSTTGHQFADIAFAANCTGKAGEAVTYSVAASGFPDVCLLEVSGCATTSPMDVSAVYREATTGTTLATSLITPAAGDHLIVVVGVNDIGGTQAVTNAGTGAATWTVIKNDGLSGEPFLIAYSVVTANGTSTYGVTYDSGAVSNTTASITTGIAAFKAASAATNGAVTAPAAVVTLAAPIPTVAGQAQAVLSAPAATLTFASFTPTVSAVQIVTITAPASVLTFAAPLPSITTTQTGVNHNGGPPIALFVATLGLPGTFTIAALVVPPDFTTAPDNLPPPYTP